MRSRKQLQQLQLWMQQLCYCPQRRESSSRGCQSRRLVATGAARVVMQ